MVRNIFAAVLRSFDKRGIRLSEAGLGTLTWLAMVAAGALLVGHSPRAAAQTQVPSNQIPSNLALLERVAGGALEDALSALELAPSEPLTILSSTSHEANGFVKRILAQKLAERGFRVKVVQSTAEVDSTEAESADGDAAPGTAAQAREQARLAAAARNEAAGEGEEEGEAPAGEGAVVETTPAPKPRIMPSDLTAYQTLPENVLPDGPVLDVEVLELGVSYPGASRTLMVGRVTYTRAAGAYLRLHKLRGPEGTLETMATGETRYWDYLGSRERSLAEGAAYPFSPPVVNAPGLGRFVEPAIVVGIVGSLIYLFYTNQN